MNTKFFKITAVLFVALVIIRYWTVLRAPQTDAQLTCATKIVGDADCVGGVTLTDFEIWRKEKTGVLTTLTADFDGNGVVDLIDFESWRRNYPVQTTPVVTATGTITNTPATATNTPTVATPLTPTGTPAASPPPTASCLNGSGPKVVISGAQSGRKDYRSSPLASNSIMDARTASWTISDHYPVILAGGSNMCFSGGKITGPFAPTDTWDIAKASAGIDADKGTVMTGLQMENVRIHDYGDAFALKGAPNFKIIGAHVSYNRDDCIENDYFHTGLVDDSLFDGCYQAFSARRDSSSQPVTANNNNVWTIQNSLIRLQPMEKVYKDTGLIPGHDGWFKWDSIDVSVSPKLALKNNIWWVSQPANLVGLGIPKGRLAECSNNIMVWTGGGTYPVDTSKQDPLPTTFNGHPCFTITTDKSVWDNAKSAWLTKHPNNQ